MTPEDRPPRKRGRRRRRRTGSADGGNGPQMTNPDSIGNTTDNFRDGSGPAAQGRRRRRHRHRGQTGGGGARLPPKAPIPTDFPPGAPTAVDGVLYIKP